MGEGEQRCDLLAFWCQSRGQVERTPGKKRRSSSPGPGGTTGARDKVSPFQAYDQDGDSHPEEQRLLALGGVTFEMPDGGAY